MTYVKSFIYWLSLQWGRLLLYWYRYRQRLMLEGAGLVHMHYHFEGFHISYYESGYTHNKKTLVLLHGFLDSSLTFRHLINALEEHYHLVLVDLPGFGRSALPAIRELWHIEGLARILTRFLFLELKIKDPVILTHSMGGLIAAHMYRYQQKHLRSSRIKAMHWIAPALLHMSAKDRNRIRRSFYPESIMEVQTLLGELSLNRDLKLPASVLRALLYEWSHAGYEMLALNTLERERSVFFDPATLDWLKLPVFLYWGKEDKVTAIRIGRNLHKALPRSELFVFPDAGHALHLDQREKFLQELLQRLP